MIELPARPLEVENPPDCVRQLIFESEWEDFPYWMHGTGFLALWGESLFLITAAHCIGADQHNALRVPVRTNEARLLPFKKFMTFEREDARDLDIAVFHANPATFVDVYDLRQAAIPISLDHSLESILAGIRAAGGADVADMTLFAIGFPRGAKASRVDLEQNRILSQPMELRIQYKYASAEQPDRHIGRIVQFELDDLDGMSGSPVFLRTTRPDELPKRYILVGMLVRASQQSVEFVSNRLLSAALQHYRAR